MRTPELTSPYSGLAYLERTSPGFRSLRYLLHVIGQLSQLRRGWDTITISRFPQQNECERVELE